MMIEPISNQLFNPDSMKLIYYTAIALLVNLTIPVLGQEPISPNKANQLLQSLKTFSNNIDNPLLAHDKARTLDTSPSQKPVEELATTDALFDLVFEYNVSDSANINGGVLGLTFTGEEFWLPNFSTDTIFRISPQGNFLGITELPLRSIFSLTYDGNTVYASDNGTSIFGIDPATFEIVDTIFTELPPILSLAFDGELDNGNGGFYLSNINNPNLGIGDIFAIDREGNSLDTIPISIHGFNGILDLEVDRISAGGPYLWVSDAGNDLIGTTLKQFSLAENRPTGILRDISLDIADPNISIGGIVILENFVDTVDVLTVLSQGNTNVLLGYELSFVPPSIELRMEQLSIPGPLSIIPIDQLDSVVVEGSFINLGFETVDSVGVLHFAFDEDINLIGAALDTFLNVGPNDTVQFESPNLFLPAALADQFYILSSEVLAFDSTIVELDTTDNFQVIFFGTSDSTLARDIGLLGFTGIPPADFPNTILGQNFALNTQDAITSITFLIVPFQENLNDIISASLYSVDPVTHVPQTFLSGTVPYIISQDDIDLTNLGQATVVTLPLAAGPFTLPEGEFYVGINQGTNELGIGTRDSLYTPNSTWVGSTAFPDNWLSNEQLFIDGEFVYAIRPEFSFCDIVVDSLGSLPDDGSGSGIAEIRISGGNPPYLFLYSNGQNDSIAENLPAGTYEINIVDNRGCRLTESIEVPLVTSIEDQLAAGVESLNVYPNPAKGNIHLDLQLSEAQTTQISINTLTGNNVFNTSLLRRKQFKEVLNLEHLSPGMYLINVTTEQGSVVQKLSIK